LGNTKSNKGKLKSNQNQALIASISISSCNDQKKKKPQKMNDCIYSQFFMSKVKNEEPRKINEEIKRNLEPSGKGGIAFHS
jgi:hypothetical protein